MATERRDIVCSSRMAEPGRKWLLRNSGAVVRQTSHSLRGAGRYRSLRLDGDGRTGVGVFIQTESPVADNGYYETRDDGPPKLPSATGGPGSVPRSAVTGTAMVEPGLESSSGRESPVADNGLLRNLGERRPPRSPSATGTRLSTDHGDW